MKSILSVLSLLLIAASHCLAQVNSNVTVAWDASQQPDITGYKVYWGALSGTAHANTNIAPVSAATLQYSVTGLAPGTAYWFYVTAVRNAEESDPSNEIQVNTGYPTPTRIGALRYTTWQTQYPTQLKLDWSAVTNVGIRNYKVVWGLVNTNNGVPVGTNTLLLQPNVLTTTISNLTTYSTYYFSCAAVSTNGIEAPMSDIIRYRVPSLPPQGVGQSFRQIITVSPQ